MCQKMHFVLFHIWGTPTGNGCILDQLWQWIYTTSTSRHSLFNSLISSKLVSWMCWVMVVCCSLSESSKPGVSAKTVFSTWCWRPHHHQNTTCITFNFKHKLTFSNAQIADIFVENYEFGKYSNGWCMQGYDQSEIFARVFMHYRGQWLLVMLWSSLDHRKTPLMHN